MAVLISREKYGRLTHPKPGFVEFMRQSSLLRLDLDAERSSDPTRVTEL